MKVTSPAKKWNYIGRHVRRIVNLSGINRWQLYISVKTTAIIFPINDHYGTVPEPPRSKGPALRQLIRHRARIPYHLFNHKFVTLQSLTVVNTVLYQYKYYLQYLFVILVMLYCWFIFVLRFGHICNIYTLSMHEKRPPSIMA